MRIGHIALSCKAGELDEVAEYYKKLGFVIYKTTVLGGLKGHFMEHEKDRSCKLDIRENQSENFLPSTISVFSLTMPAGLTTI